jgi:hypothetical protein
MITFFAGFLLGIAIVPKYPILLPPGTPRWITHVSGGAKTDLSSPTPRLKIIFLCSLTLYLAIIWFAGPSIVRLLVSHGVVLHL